MRRLPLLVGLVLLCVVGSITSAGAYYLDTPHNESNGIYCYTCHSMSYWRTPPTGGWGGDVTIRNSICLQCHAEGSTDPLRGPAKRLHASSTTSAAKGTWSTECTQCHDVHSQGQLDWAATDDSDLYLAWGTLTSTGTYLANDPVYSPLSGSTTFTISGVDGLAGWIDTATWAAKGGKIDKTRAADGSRGLVFVPKKSNPSESYEIIAATPTSVKVKGRITTLGLFGSTFGVIYGQSIKSLVMPNGGSTVDDYCYVKFFKPEVVADKSGGYIDESGSAKPEGLCQVCHDSTAFWNKNGSNTDHNRETACSICHDVVKGLAGSHSGFIGDRLGTGCGTCHLNHVTSPQSGHRGGCNTCHSTKPAINNNILSNEGGVTVSSVLINGGYSFTPRLTYGEGKKIGYTGFPVVDCSECHELKRAAVLGGTHGGHGAASFGWNSNCGDCHGPTSRQVVKDVHSNSCTTCHDQSRVAVGDYTVRIDGSSAYGVDGSAVGATTLSKCTDCHNTNTPAVVHHVSKNSLAANNCSTSCHATSSNHKGNHALIVAGSADCNYCHAANVGGDSSVGAPINGADNKIHDNCYTCHNSDTTLKTLAQVGGSKIIAMPNGGSGTNNGGGTCLACHGEYFANHTNITHTVRVAGIAACTACHTATAGTATGVPVSAGDNKVHDGCTTCHGNTGALLAKSDANAHGYVRGVMAAGDCGTCHTSTYFDNHVHGTTGGYTTHDVAYNASLDLSQGSPGTPCASCHTPAGGLAVWSGIVNEHGDCARCHGYTNGDGLNSPPLATNNTTITSGNGVHCVTCHTEKLTPAIHHIDGGSGGGGGTGCGTSTTCHGLQKSHPTHVSGQILSLTCSDCHNTANFPKFSDGATSKAATTVCYNCHTTAGAVVAKQYFSYPGSAAGTAGSWLAVEGEKSFCGSCHNATSGNSKGDGSGSPAFNVLGDDVTFGFYVTGHGKSTGTYTKLSYQETTAVGNPAANRHCSDCHDLTAAHFDNSGNRLKSGYANNQTNDNCNQCHPPGTQAVGDPQFYTGPTPYEASAHGGKLCSECHDVHGTVKNGQTYSATNAAMTRADKQNLCNQCHSGVGGHPGAGSAQFTVSGKNYTLQCISCHNVHVVTGKYSEAAQNKSPVTRFVDNTNVWGDSPAEKMNAYAGSGTYRKPTGESFTGDQLPDYATFCTDCHSQSGAAPFGINWNSDPHGKGAANQPNGYGTCPNWYGCGKAFGWDGDDCTGSQAECWPVVPRGAGDQIFSREAYTHTERVAGANFTLSCTDCHTGHGSGTLGRPNVNGGAFTSNWNNMCNNCHFYYSDWHAGMSCGTASCHISDRMNQTGIATPHSMTSSSGSGGTRPAHTSGLVLSYAFEGNLNDSGGWQMDGKWYSTAGSFATGKTGQAVVLGEDTGVQVGTENGYWSTDEGYHGTWKYTEMKYNTTLESWVYPTDNAKSEYTIFDKHVGIYNGGYVFSLKKIGGVLTAAFNMQADNNGFAQGGAAGIRGAYSSVTIPLNKWTHVAATFDTNGPDRNPANPAVGRIRIYVNGVDVTTSDSSGNNMQPGANETSIYAYSENSPWNQSICYDGSWCASEFSIGGFDWESTNFIGKIDEAKVWNITKPVSYFDAINAANAPEIISAEVTRVNQLTVTFSEGVYTNNNSTGALLPADFVYTDIDNGRTITAVTHTAGSRTAVLTLSSNLDTSNDIGVDTVRAAANSIFDNYALAAGTATVTISGNLTPPVINSAIVSSANKVTVTFAKAVYANSDLTGALTPADFTYTDVDNGRTITAVTHTAGNTTAVLTLSTNIDATNDIGIDTVAAAANAIFDNMGLAADTTAVTLSGSLCPSPATFNLNEAPGSTTVQDTQGYLAGAVYGSSVMTGNEYSGDGSSKYITFTGNDACLQATTALTLEARIKPTGITVTGNTDYIARIFARNYNATNYQLSIWRKNTAYPGLFTAPDNQAVIALWVPTNGTSTFKPVLTNYTGAKTGSENDCPIVSDHWYLVKAVWNTNKPGGTPGQFFTPADIYIDDQGTDGAGAGENWSGYINCTDADQSLKSDSAKFYTNDYMTSSSGSFTIGANTSSATTLRFNGLIDWITWKDTAD